MSLKSQKSRIGRPCIGDKPMTATERKRRSRAIKKKADDLQTLTQAVKITDNNIIAEVIEDPPEYIDTTSWTMQEWEAKFQPNESPLLPHQLENQAAMLAHKMGMIEDPRQHGKTNYTLKRKFLFEHGE